MIRRKTLLILGAGASIPYRIWPGAALTDRLCSWAWTEPGQELAQLFIDCDSSPIELRQFGQAFHRSLLPSVDTFLAHRPEMATVGKLAIAHELASRESDEERDWFVEKDHWYRHLWNRMRAGTENNARYPEQRPSNYHVQLRSVARIRVASRDLPQKS